MPPDDSLFPNPDELLISVYQKQGRTLDDLPYTPEFDRIAQGMGEEAAGRAGLFRRLHNLRKAGRLPRMGRAAEAPPRVDVRHEKTLIEVVESEIGSISLRDRLPYTTEFDRVVERFNTLAGLSLSQHAVWRLIAKLAK